MLPIFPLIRWCAMWYTHEPIVMPSGAYPARISVQKSCPDRSEVNGCRLLLRQSETPPPPAPGSALTAVPTAMNSAMSLPNSFISTSSRTPTMPSAPSASASASIRVMASSRAWYMAWDSTSSSWFFPQRPTCSPTWEIELPSTRPSGRNPTWRRGVPGRLRSSLTAALCFSLSSELCWSVIVSPHPAHAASPAGYCPSASQPHPCGLAALRVERQDRQRWWRLGHRGEPDHGGAHDRRLHDVIFAVLLDRALALVDPHVHLADHDAFPAQAAHVFLQLLAGVVPGIVHQLGVAPNPGVARAPPGLAHGQPVVVPGPDGDAQRQPGRHPARGDHLREVLPGQVGAERLRERRRSRRAHRGADRLELQPASGERADRQGHPDDAVPAQLGALGGHPGDGQVPRVVHGLGERTERAVAAPPGHLGHAAVRLRVRAEPGPRPRAVVPAREADVVDGGAEHLADGLEARRPDRGELLGAERRTPGPAGLDFLHPGLGSRGKVVTRPVIGHRAPLPASSQTPRYLPAP